MTTADVAVVTRTQAGALSGAALAALGGKVAALTTAAVSGLTASQIGALTSAQVATLSTSQIGALTTAAAGLTANDIGAMSVAQDKALSTAALSAMSASQIGAMSASQIGALSTAQIGALGAIQISGFTAAQAQSLTKAQLAVINKTQAGALSTGALSALGSNVSALSSAAISGRSANQVGALTATEIGSLSNAQIAAVTTSIGGLTTSQIAAFTNSQVTAMSNSTLNAMSTGQIGGFAATQVAAMTASQINGLSATNMTALNASGFTAAQVAGLTAKSLGALSTSQFSAGVAANVAKISTAAIPGLSVGDINTLTVSEMGEVTAAQIAAMNATQKTALQNAETISGGEALLQKYGSNGAIGYDGMLSLLDAETSGGMTSAKMNALQGVANLLNVAGGVATSAYVQQITDDVIDGDSANAYWNGGGVATALGNLSAASTAAQASELIGKWFLGSDLPSTDLSSAGMYNYSPTYQPDASPLYGTSGSPQASDVNQGYIGDCYFVSALAEVAQQDPSVIKNMISENDNGTYSVDFQINGKSDYVTVNNELPTFAYSWANGSKLEFANGSTSWAPLVEKAYVELNEQTGAGIYGNKAAKGASYADINGGNAWSLSQITGQSVSYDYIKGSSAASLTSLAGNIASTLKSGGEVIMANLGGDDGNLVGGHMFEIAGFNAATQTVTIQNPWNTAAAGGGMKFTETLSQLAAHNVEFALSQRGTSMAQASNGYAAA